MAHHAGEAEHVTVEGDASRDVAHVQDGVVEAVDRHDGNLRII
jgi:hypothetical protein